MSRRVQMRIAGIVVLAGSLGIGSAAMAVTSKPSGPPGKTGVYTPCPKTGYTSRPCSTHK